ncbi:MAG: alpha/beta fold hydrolase [Gemmataceae bacterium]
MDTSLMPRLHGPIVLVHGLFGFTRIQMGRIMRFDYFRGVIPALEAAGNRVLAASLSPTSSIACRADQLRSFLQKHIPDEPVHLVAHSMGGLDARYMISKLGMASSVLSLTTLGTPHRGSPFADWAAGHLAPLVAPVFDLVQASREAFDDLTAVRCKAFNEDVLDQPGVRYFSVAARHAHTWRNPTWSLSYPIVFRSEGPNDGVVSIQSAHWGESCEVWEGDHVSLINWPQPGVKDSLADRLPHYRNLFGRLRDEGF